MPARQRPPLPPGPHLIVGLARSGVAAARALAARGETVIGVDQGTPAVPELADAGVELHLGESGIDLLEPVRSVIKSPGVPAQAPVVRAARERGLPVMGELELAWRLLANEFVAITGTNGKTTTVELVGHIHRRAGVPVVVAGNVGTAVSGLVGELDPATVIVCEASSFQLQDTIAFAPEAAVLLNLGPDHLDRHGTMEAYRAAKLQAFARQRPEDLAVAPAGWTAAELGGAARLVSFGADAGADLREHDGALWWQGERLLGTAELSLRGAHNAQNAMAAAAVCLARGIGVDAVGGGLRGFPGVPHRLEEVARHGGVAFVNDSKATNVDSTLVALAALGDTGVHLILGGQGKGQDFAPLEPAVAVSCRAVYLIGQDAPQLQRALAGAGVPVLMCGALEPAVQAARDAARPGDTVLLSPACASFDQFRDFEARGDRFRELAQRDQGRRRSIRR